VPDNRIFLLISILSLLTTFPLAAFSTTDEEEEEENDEEQTSSENEDEGIPESREENGAVDNEQEQVGNTRVDPTTGLITDTDYGISIKSPDNLQLADIYEAKPNWGRQIRFEDPNDPFTNLNLLIFPPEEVQSYLDTDAMQVRNATLENYTSGRRVDFLGSTSLNFIPVGENQTTIAGNPAVVSEYRAMYGFTPLSYYVTVHTINDNKLYILDFEIDDELNAPKLIPVIKKMIDSFQMMGIPSLG
jgi:hypothetical protein